MLQLIELFCNICEYLDEKGVGWETRCIGEGKKRSKESCLTYAEIMTIEIYFHMCTEKYFKTYFNNIIYEKYKGCFPEISYSYFLKLKPRILGLTESFLRSKFVTNTGIFFIDSTMLKACHIKRSFKHKTLKNHSSYGYATMGIGFGLKLHIIIDSNGNIANFTLTKANIDDRSTLLELTKNLKGILVGDSGYVSKGWVEILKNIGINLIAKPRKNMKKILSQSEQYLIKKRPAIESVFNLIKNRSHVDHTRHRSFLNFKLNLLSGILAYTFNPIKSFVY